MLEVFLTVIPSICWMLFRCWQLLSAPADRLARQLNIQIPHTPVISVHGISKSDICIQWHVKTPPEHNIFFVVLVNGHDAGTLAHTSARLSHLQENTIYKIQILAVNVINNFRSESVPVYVRTAGIDIDIPPVCPPPADTPAGTTEIAAIDVPTTTSESILMSLLSSTQAQIAQTVSDSAVLHQRSLDDEIALQTEYATCKRELEVGHEIRAKKGMDLKGLEKHKDALAFKKLKLSKILNHYEMRRNMHSNKHAELQSKLRKMQDKEDHSRPIMASEGARVASKLSESYGELQASKAHITHKEAQMAETLREQSEINRLIDRLRPLIQSFAKPAAADENTQAVEVWSHDGALTPFGESLVAQILDLTPEWADDFYKEYNVLKAQEDAWKLSFRAHLRKHIALHNSIESARLAADPSYVPVALSEYQASVEFGGFANALRKPQEPEVPMASSQVQPSLYADPATVPREMSRDTSQDAVFPSVPDPEYPEYGDFGLDFARVAPTPAPAYSEPFPPGRPFMDPYISPPSEPVYAPAQSKSLWAPVNSLGSYSGLSLSPPPPERLSLQGGMDNGLSHMMLSGPAHNIWSSKPSSIKLGPSRSVSSGSTIWRDVKRDFSPTSGISREFSPFAETEGQQSPR